MSLSLYAERDVEGANMDHNMSISNPCISTSDLLKRAYLQPTPVPFSAFGQHRFIMRSGYRTSPRDFAAVGLQLLNSTRPTSDLEVRREQKGDVSAMIAQVPQNACRSTVHSAYCSTVHSALYCIALHTLMCKGWFLCTWQYAGVPPSRCTTRGKECHTSARLRLFLVFFSFSSFFFLCVYLQCFWMGADGRKIEGTFKPVYPGEHHELMYETVVFKCRLEEPTTGRGGGTAIMLLGKLTDL